MNEVEKIKVERKKLVYRLERALDGPMIFLGFVWLVLLIVEFTVGLTRPLEVLSFIIWSLFILDFIISFLIAPVKGEFLKKNVLTLISLIVPAIRILKIIRLLRVIRGLRLVKVLSSLNRGMRSLAATMSKRAFGYMVLLTLLIILVGAAGMLAFENDHQSGLKSYSESLWWTAMVVITVGTEYWPTSPEGRILCFALALYGFAVLGYITATLATFFIDLDTQSDHSRNHSEKIREELRVVRKLLEELRSDKKTE